MKQESLSEDQVKQLRLIAFLLEEALRRTEAALRTQYMTSKDLQAVMTAAEPLTQLLGS